MPYCMSQCRSFMSFFSLVRLKNNWLFKQVRSYIVITSVHLFFGLLQFLNKLLENEKQSLENGIFCSKIILYLCAMQTKKKGFYKLFHWILGIRRRLQRFLHYKNINFILKSLTVEKELFTYIITENFHHFINLPYEENPKRTHFNFRSQKLNKIRIQY